MFSIISVLSFLISQTLVSNSYSAQADYYLKIDTIKGSAVVNGEEGWIQLKSVQYIGDPDFDLKAYFKTSNSGADALTDGLLILREVDKSSPVILDALASGTHIPKGKLVLCEDGKCDSSISLLDINFLNYTMSSNQDSVLETILISFNTKSDADKIVIPSWIKNNAKWFGEGTIGPSDFSKGIEFMINENIINIPDLPASSGVSETKMPDWVKNNAKWWADGQIPDQDFVKGIQFLVEKGIIKVN